VLDFTAPEGVVLLPRKVSQCLFGLEGGEAGGRVTVRYRRLEKGAYVKLQPRWAWAYGARGACVPVLPGPQVGLGRPPGRRLSSRPWCLSSRAAPPGGPKPRSGPRPPCRAAPPG
jgi:hypothetical protein